jgi:hypothetical protein
MVEAIPSNSHTFMACILTNRTLIYNYCGTPRLYHLSSNAIQVVMPVIGTGEVSLSYLCRYTGYHEVLNVFIISPGKFLEGTSIRGICAIIDAVEKELVLQVPSVCL